MKSFPESEAHCRATFGMCGETYHAYTSGRDMPVIFATDEDLSFAMNAIALAASKFRESITIIAFTVMNNHFHFILCAEQRDIGEFFRYILKKLKRTIPLAGKMRLSLKPIEDLSGMRNNIVYTHRNGYVVNPAHTPFSYPWGTGKYYFNDTAPSATTFADVGYMRNRKMFKGANVHLPSDWQLTTDGHISPASFCAIKTGMAMFRDAHHYFAAVSKNVEAYSGIAVELDDGEFLTDQELFTQLCQIVRDRYQIASLRELTKAQRLDLARTLHYDYRSSNGQIRRVLGLDRYELDQLFPLHAERKPR